MATEGNRRYLQYILLLGEGSTIVLKGLIGREVRRKETSLEILLNDNKKSLERQLRNRKQFHHIFPPDSPANTDLDTWDIALLAKVILLLTPSSLTWHEKAAVRLIKDMRNELFAHAPMMSFVAEDFDGHWGDLRATLTQLMTSLESAIQEKCEGVIRKLENGINNVDEVTRECHVECKKCDEQLSKLVDTVSRMIKSEVKPISEKLDECFVLVTEQMEQNKDDIKQELQSTSKEIQDQMQEQACAIQESIELKAGELGSFIHATAGTASEHLDNIEGGIEKANVQLENVSNDTRELHTLNEDIHQKVDAISEQVCENTKQSSATCKKVEEMEKTIKILCEQMGQMQKQGKDFKTPQDLEIEIEITGPSEEINVQADEQLIKAFENAMSKVKRIRLEDDTKRNTDLDKLVQQFKDNIDELEGVEIQEVKKACVRLSLKCSHAEDMVGCVNYMFTCQCLDQFEQMARVLTTQFDQHIELKVHIIPASLQKALDEMECIIPVKQLLRLPVRCSTLWGMQQLCGMMTGNQVQKTFREISGCLSDHYGRQITVRGQLNIPKIHRALKEVTAVEDNQNVTAEAAEGFTPRGIVYKIHSIRRVNIKLKDDRSVSYVYRLCQTSDGSILIADYNNQRLKRMNTSYELVDFCNLPAKPWGVCDLCTNEAVVALNNNSLQFVSLGENLTLTKAVRLTHPCWSLSYHGGRLFIKGGNSVYSYNTFGEDKRDVYTDPTEDAAYQNIKVSDDGERIYIANDQKGVVAIDLDGKTVGMYEDQDIERVDDICSDGEGNMYICNKTSSIISQIDEGDLVKVGNISDRSNTIQEPWVMCFNRLQPTLIVGHSRSDTITIAELTK